MSDPIERRQLRSVMRDTSDLLLQAYRNGEYVVVAGQARFEIGGLRLALTNSQESIREVAELYRIAAPTRWPSARGNAVPVASPSTRRPRYSDRIYKKFTAEGELENAQAYADLYGIDPDPQTPHSEDK
jgi:hypothetical protein